MTEDELKNAVGTIVQGAAGCKSILDMLKTNHWISDDLVGQLLRQIQIGLNPHLTIKLNLQHLSDLDRNRQDLIDHTFYHLMMWVILKMRQVNSQFHMNRDRLYESTQRLANLSLEPDDR